MSVEVALSYNVFGLGRNAVADGPLDRLQVEAVCGQPTRRFEATPPPLDDPVGARPFRLEQGEYVLDVLGGDPALFEVVPDEGVAVAATRKPFGAREGHSRVVEVPGAGEHFGGIAARTCRDAPAGQALVDLMHRERTTTERAGGEFDRFRATACSGEPPCPLAVEVTALVKPRGRHGGYGQRAPGPVVEVHGDPAALQAA
jgi:hypothetical protein